MREQLIKKAEIFPIEFIVRNVATGSLTKRLGIPEGTILEKPLLEYCFKDDELSDPLISKEHILTFGWATEKELNLIDKSTHRINDILSGMFRAINIKLIDFKIEYGKVWNKDIEKKEIVLADEISPDTCRLWDAKTEKKLDKYEDYPQRNQKHETINLSFGQRIGSLLFDWILGSQNKKRLLQLVNFSCNRDSFFLHCFQKGRLSFGWSPIYFVG